MAGLVIAIEGLDGSGKSTQAALLSQHLRSHGQETEVMRLNENRILERQWHLLNQRDLIGPTHAAPMQAADLASRNEYFVRPLPPVEAAIIGLTP